MSEKVVIINPNQKVGSTDLTEIGKFAREGIDHLTLDAISGGQSGYTGFNAVKTAQTKVTVGAGRFYAPNGAIHAFEGVVGKEIDFLAVLPAVAKRIAAIVVFGTTEDTQTEAREFVTDTTTGETEARNVATENWRVANVSYFLGDEAASPIAPAVPANYVVVAFATLTPTSVVDPVVMNDTTRLRSVRDAFGVAQLVSASLAAIGPKLVSIGNDVAGLKIDVNGKLDADFGYRMAFDLAQLKRQAGVPDTYIDYGDDTFIDGTQSSTVDGANGYSAKVQEGLRFPAALTNVLNGIALLNPNDATVYKDNTGLVLPAWQDTRTRLVAGTSGDIALNSIIYDTTTILIANMSRTRVRMGPEFVVGQSWLNGATLTDPVRLYYQKNGETFQAYPDPGLLNPDGTQQIRVRQQWFDTVNSTYWTRDSTNAPVVAGYKYAETFLNARDLWCTAIGLGGFTYIDMSGGAMVLMLAECDDAGRPNDQKVLAMTSVMPSQIPGLAQFCKFPIVPTMLEKGKYYCFIISSAANHHIAISDSQEPAVGSLFYKNGQGYWQADPAKHIKIDLWYAEFPRTRTEVQLQTLTLAGGIASIDFLAQMIVPSSASLTLEVQVAGAWVPLTADNVANQPFASTPVTLPFRLVFSGGGTVQAGVNLNTLQLILSRPAPALKHFSTPRIIPTATTKVRTKTRIENWDPAKHTVTPKLKAAGGAEISAGLISDQLVGNDVLVRTAFFTLGAAATQYQRVTQATTTDVSDLCVITDVGDVATAT